MEGTFASIAECGCDVVVLWFRRLDGERIELVFTARRYGSEVYAVVMCPSVTLAVSTHSIPSVR